MTANYRGDAPIYPASVVKLFYLEAAHRWMQDGKINDTPELRRAMKDMIVLSYNEATHYVLDVLTDTTSGPELPPAQMEKWSEKRNAVNRYFASRGYTNINVNQKPWCEGPYGRERIFVGESYSNRNALTTDATARLLMEIATDHAVSETRSRQMLELLKRDPTQNDDSEENQVKGFTGSGLPAGSKLWSKAGWTSNTRHDAALVELPSGKKFILVTFTLNHASDTTLIPFVAKTFSANFQ
jgi:beta-lactamase class A